MSKTKKAALPSFVYPPEQAMQSGCKVSWRYYTKREDALLAADVAKLEAEWLAGQGYDFGYQSPGDRIELIAAGRKDGFWKEYAGMYEVCVP